MEVDETEAHLKSVIKYNKNHTNRRIFNEMTTISRKVYNCCVFSFNVYKLFQNEIFEDLFNQLKLNPEYYPKITGKVDRKNHSKYNDAFYKIYDKYYQLYSKNLKLYKENNNIIYKEICLILENKTLNRGNIETKTDEIKLKLANKVKYDESNQSLVYDKIINNIIRSFYCKNYFQIKNDLVNHKPLKIKDSELTEEVKKNQFYFADFYANNFHKKITEELKIDQNSQRNLLKFLIFNYYLNENKNKLPTDIIINIIEKFNDNVSSYYGKLKKHMKANKPNFIDDKFGLFYYCRSFKIVKNRIRLTVGKYISENYDGITRNANLKKINYRNWCNYQNITEKRKKDDINLEIYSRNKKYVSRKNIQDRYYIYINLPKNIKNKKIPLVQIIPEHKNYKIVFSYYEDKKHIDNNNKSGYASIDLGINNLMTIYDPEGKQKIIKGNTLKNTNNYFNTKLDKLKSEIKKYQNIHTSKRFYQLLSKRKRLVDAELNKIVNTFYENYKNKKEIIVGYNENWKENVNLGKKVNRIFYEIPYYLLLKKLEYKLAMNGIKFTKIEESYTSKCDSLSLEKLCRKENYNGKRIRRGLYLCQNGKVINADLNGAINIMRKVIPLKKISGEDLFNPLRITM